MHKKRSVRDFKAKVDAGISDLVNLSMNSMSVAKTGPCCPRCLGAIFRKAYLRALLCDEPLVSQNDSSH